MTSTSRPLQAPGGASPAEELQRLEAALDANVLKMPGTGAAAASQAGGGRA